MRVNRQFEEWDKREPDNLLLALDLQHGAAKDYLAEGRTTLPGELRQPGIRWFLKLARRTTQLLVALGNSVPLLLRKVLEFMRYYGEVGEAAYEWLSDKLVEYCVSQYRITRHDARPLIAAAFPWFINYTWQRYLEWIYARGALNAIVINSPRRAA